MRKRHVKVAKAILNHPHKRAIENAIAAGQKDSDVAQRFGLDKQIVKKHRERNIPEYVAEVALADKGRVLETLLRRIDGMVTPMEKTVRACEKVLIDPATGEYDLKNLKKSAPYIKMLALAVKVGTPALAEMARITLAVKETAEIKNNPVLILAQIGQIIQSAGTREEMIANIKRLAQDNDSRD